MKRLFWILLLFVTCSARAQSPEELYEQYITPETRAILERAEQQERNARAARAAAKAQNTLALSLAVLIGLIPLCYIGRNILKGKTWKENPYGTLKALGVGLAGSVLLFGLNYGIYLLKVKRGDAFNTTLAFLIVAALVAGAIYLMKKNDNSRV